MSKEIQFLIYQTAKDDVKNIFDEGELNEQELVSKMEITTIHGAIQGKTQTLKKCSIDHKTQKITSDFDKAVKELGKNGGER